VSGTLAVKLGCRLGRTFRVLPLSGIRVLPVTVLPILGFTELPGLRV
jgi:hypothetical protein